MFKRILLIFVIVFFIMSILFVTAYLIIRPKSNVFVLIMSGDSKKLEYLIDKDPALINISDRWQSTPLHWAARLEDNDIVKTLIDAGASVRARDMYGNTPLHCAAESWNEVLHPRWNRDKERQLVSSESIVVLLIESGADINAVNKYDFTPLHEAARSGDIEVAEILIRAGADINAKCVRRSLTPLHTAAYSGNCRVVKILIENGADISLKSGIRGNTPFHLAVGSGKDAIEVCKVFLDNGAKVDQINYEQYTPLDLAKDYGVKELIDFLQSYTSKE